jgi:hypothetical protein
MIPDVIRRIQNKTLTMKMIFDSQREIDFTIGKFHHGYLQGQGVQYQKGKFFL